MPGPILRRLSLSRELAELDGVVDAIRAYRAMEDNLNGAPGAHRRFFDRSEMRSLVEDELPPGPGRPAKSGAGPARHAAADEADEKSAILEIRAGTGGDEAALRR